MGPARVAAVLSAGGQFGTDAGLYSGKPAVVPVGSVTASCFGFECPAGPVPSRASRVPRPQRDGRASGAGGSRRWPGSGASRMVLTQRARSRSASACSGRSWRPRRAGAGAPERIARQAACRAGDSGGEPGHLLRRGAAASARVPAWAVIAASAASRRLAGEQQACSLSSDSRAASSASVRSLAAWPRPSARLWLVIGAWSGAAWSQGAGQAGRCGQGAEPGPGRRHASVPGPPRRAMPARPGGPGGAGRPGRSPG